MFEPLPERLDLLRDAAKGRSFSGRVSLSRMERLREAVLDEEGEAEVEFVLDRDEAGRSFMKGRARMTVSLTCQRCLDPVGLELDARFSLGLVRGEEEAGRLPDDFEPLLVGRDPMDVAPLVEDELLLVLPAVPRHDSCDSGYTPEPLESEEEPEEEAPRENPFAALAALKKGGGSDH